MRTVLVRRLAHRMVVSIGHAASAGRPRLRRRGHGGRRRRRRDRAAKGRALTDAAAERARQPTGPAFSDAVTFSFGDPDAGLYGLARLGLSGADGDRTGSALAMLFSGSQPVAVHARGAVPLDAGAGLERLALPGLEATVDEPLRHWTVRFDDGERSGFELELRGVRAAGRASRHPSIAAQTGGMEGYEQLCRVHGTVRTNGSEHEVRCLGQRGHAWGEPDWERIESTRTLGAWLDDGTGILLTRRAAGRCRRPRGRRDLGGRRSAPPAACASTSRGSRRRTTRAAASAAPASSCGSGRTTTYPRRASGEVVCGSTLELGQLRLDCAFLRWRMGGRAGIGRYDLLRRA